MVNKAFTIVGSSAAFFSCWRKDGLWKATQAGKVLVITRSHSCIKSGESLFAGAAVAIMLASFQVDAAENCETRHERWT